jgi:hypothetical protein
VDAGAKYMIDIEQFLMSLRRHKDADGKLNPIYLADTIAEETEIIKEAIKHSRRWVGLTDKEIDNLYEQHHNQYGQSEFLNYERAIENALRGKNK